jgi:hypothetical protein
VLSTMVSNELMTPRLARMLEEATRPCKANFCSSPGAVDAVDVHTNRSRLATSDTGVRIPRRGCSRGDTSSALDCVATVQSYISTTFKEEFDFVPDSSPDYDIGAVITAGGASRSKKRGLQVENRGADQDDDQDEDHDDDDQDEDHDDCHDASRKKSRVCQDCV